MKHVFDSFDGVSERDVHDLLDQGASVYIVEPFVNYSRKKGAMTHMPQPKPAFIQALIESGRITQIPAIDLDSKSIHVLAADRAVNVIESVFDFYHQQHKALFASVISMCDATIIDAFKKELCDRLADVYSCNILLERLSNYFEKNEEFVFYPDLNVSVYDNLIQILIEKKQRVFDHTHIQFGTLSRKQGRQEDIRSFICIAVKLMAQTCVSLVLFPWALFKQKSAPKQYRYGVMMVSPGRQLKDGRARFDFLVDDNKIKSEECVYFIPSRLTPDERERLLGLTQHVYDLPQSGSFFSHPHYWFTLLKEALFSGSFSSWREINTASIVLFHYLKWQQCFQDVHVNELITHCDFGVGHIARDIVLKKHHVRSWYFTDSMNLGCNYVDPDSGINHDYPFWAYMHYDRFVTWSPMIAQYFAQHPGGMQRADVVGCLWTPKQTSAKENKQQNAIVVAAFDTTYSWNGYANYKEGVAFARDLLRLLDEREDVQVYFKEKKERRHLPCFDPEHADQLIEVYEELSRHDRVKLMLAHEDTFSVIAESDVVVSFPFTSPTYEALSLHKKAVWHDPKGVYQQTWLGRGNGVMTHSYDELKAFVAQARTESGASQLDILKKLGFADPFSDAQAIERFRDLLTAEGEKSAG